jgi:hypothetical protein
VIAGVESRGELPSPLSPSPSPSLPCTRPPSLPCAHALAHGGARPARPSPCAAAWPGGVRPLPSLLGPGATPPRPHCAAAPALALAPARCLPPAPPRGGVPGPSARSPAPGATPTSARSPTWLAWPWRGLALPRLPVTRSRVRNHTRAVIILDF